MAGNPNLAVLFSHPVYQYFEAGYGINGRSVHWEPGEMPDDAKWGELTALLKKAPSEVDDLGGKTRPGDREQVKEYRFGKCCFCSLR